MSDTRRRSTPIDRPAHVRSISEIAEIASVEEGPPAPDPQPLSSDAGRSLRPPFNAAVALRPSSTECGGNALERRVGDADVSFGRSGDWPRNAPQFPPPQLRVKLSVKGLVLCHNV